MNTKMIFSSLKAVLTAVLVSSVLVSGACFEEEAPKDPNSTPLDRTRFVTNLTQMVRAKGSEDKTMPAYVQVLSSKGGTCDVDSQVITEVRKIISAFKRNEDEGGKRNNMILVGEPGMDVDARVETLAWRLANGCPEIPESWKMREVISFDLKILKHDAKSNGLSSSQYINELKTSLKRILDKWGQKAIFYLNDFPALAYSDANDHQPLNVDAILRLFLEYNANVIIESTPLEFNKYFANARVSHVISHLSLAPLSSDLVLPALSATTSVLAKNENVSVDESIIEDIVRLTRAFLPGRGALSQASAVLDRVVQSALNTLDHVATRSMVAEAISYLNPDVQQQAIENSDALDRNTALKTIDANVALIKNYYVNPNSRGEIATAATTTLEPAVDDLKKNIAEVQNRLSEVERRILENLESKIKLLTEKIEHLGNTVNSVEVQLSEKLVKQSAEIASVYELVSKKSDADKVDSLNKLMQAQSTTLASLESKLGQLSESQQDMIGQLSTTREQLAKAIADVDTKSNKESAAALKAIADLESSLAEDLKSLGSRIDDNQSAVLDRFSKNNSSLAILGAQLHTLTTNEAETFNQLLDTQKMISKRVLTRLHRLSDAQTRGISSVQAGLNQVTQNLKTTDKELSRKMTTNYKDLLEIIEKAKLEAVADAAANLAEAKRQLSMDLSKVDTKVDQVKSSLLARLSDDEKALSDVLTRAIGTAKAEAIADAVSRVAAATTQLSGDISKLDTKVDVIKTDLLARLADDGKALSDVLTKAIGTAKSEAIADAAGRIARSTTQLSSAISKVDSKVDIVKTDLLARLADDSKTLTDILTKAIGTAKGEAIADSVSRVAAATTQLSGDISKLDTKVDIVKTNLLARLSDDNKALADVLTKAMSISKSEAILEAASLVADTTRQLSADISKVDSKVDLVKTGLLARLSDDNQALTAVMNQAIASSKADAIADAVSKIAAATAQLSSDIVKVDARVEFAKSEMLSKLTIDDKALTDLLMKAISNAKAEAIADAAGRVAGATAQLSQDISTVDARIDHFSAELLAKLSDSKIALTDALTKAIGAAKAEAIADAAGKLSDIAKTLSAQIAKVSTGADNTRTELLAKLTSDLSSLEKALNTTIASGNADAANKIGEVSQALKNVSDALSKRASIAQFDGLKYDFDTKFGDLLGLLFDTAGIIEYREKADFNRDVRTLDSCLETLVDQEKQALTATQMIVECAHKCMIVDQRFWMTANEAGDRKMQNSFEIHVGMQGTEYLSTIRCTQK